jgi:hypothetical protein
MAEMLVLAKEPWNNDIDTSKMDAEELTSFSARFRKGDIIVVRPDGWKWGKEECLPNFVVIKISDKYEEAKMYESPSETKLRNYCIPAQEVDQKVVEVKDLVDIVPVELSSGTAITPKDS